jgi:hypothetical protein
MVVLTSWNFTDLLRFLSKWWTIPNKIVEILKIHSFNFRKASATIPLHIVFLPFPLFSFFLNSDCFYVQTFKLFFRSSILLFSICIIFSLYIVPYIWWFDLGFFTWKNCITHSVKMVPWILVFFWANDIWYNILLCFWPAAEVCSSHYITQLRR